LDDHAFERTAAAGRRGFVDEAVGHATKELPMR
jgi:hypothetical protein